MKLPLQITFRNLEPTETLEEHIRKKAEKLEQLRAIEHGFKIKVPETFSDSIEVDIPEDVPKIEAILSGSGRID